ncbi:acyltransferase family protein [Glaciecola petra]|uniref:Acyltransferase n=1 Tax=Glaciecola petra TaxID=3075602 RepID=A0ABU2ZLV2_9ALTE|nr:acyltransferase [Aestuariibacter sp. P117]MDT0593610.1 acyltransferase [Aestuariibacter sp. P117]
MQANDKRYLTQLTWLRGIAATLVVVAHSVRMAEDVYLDTQTSTVIGFIRFFDLGTFGVMLFFALSGATLYFSNKHVHGLRGLAQFYVKRFFRIWPAFAVSLFIYMAFMPIFQTYYVTPRDNWIESQFLSDWSFIDLMGYLTLTFNIQGPNGLFNNAYWSLPVEFQYYLVFPLLVLSMRYTSIFGPIVIAVVSYIVHREGYISMESTWVFMLAFTFCFGIVFAYLYERIKIRLHAALGLLLFACFFIACTLTQQGYIDFGTLPVISNPFGFNGIFGLLCMGALLFTNFTFDKGHTLIKPFYWLGEISYSLYLYHNLVIGALTIICIQFAWPTVLESATLIFLIVMPISMIIAKISYETIEVSGIKLSRNIAKKLLS